MGKAVRLDPAEFDLANGEWNDVTVIATEVEGGMNVTVAIQDAEGTAFLPFSDLFVEGASFPNGARAAFGGRTGGSLSTQRIDEVYITWTGGGGLEGDYNNNRELDAEDLDLQAIEMQKPVQNLAEYDLNGDNVVDFEDRQLWVEDLKKTWIGDANLDLQFDSSDMVQVFTAGKYEKQGETVTWEEGDWNGDLNFDSSDMVAAFVGGGYEMGLRDLQAVAASAVPEPSAHLMGLLGMLGLLWRRRRAS